MTDIPFNYLPEYQAAKQSIAKFARMVKQYTKDKNHG